MTMTKEMDTIKEADLSISSFVLEWFRIIFPLLVNFGQFIKMHHPLSPLLLRNFIEVFAALANLIASSVSHLS